MGDIPLDKAYLLALWVETLLFGVYTVVFITCLYVVFWKRGGRASWMLIMPTFLLYLFAGSHVCIVLVRNIRGFTGRGRLVLGGAEIYFREVYRVMNVSNQFIYATNNLMGDGVLIWRCWVIWNRQWKVIVVPCFLLLGTAVSGYGSAWQFRLARNGIFNHSLETWAKIFFLFTLITNLLVTCLTAGRIWFMSRRLTKMMQRSRSSNRGTVSLTLNSEFLPEDRYWGIIIMFIESGALYSSAIVCEMILLLMRTNALYIVFNAMAQIIGIVPTMIVVLVGLGITKRDMTVSSSQETSIRFGSTTNGGSTRPTRTINTILSSHRPVRSDRYGTEAVGDGGVDVVDLEHLPSSTRTIQLSGAQDRFDGDWKRRDSVEFNAGGVLGGGGNIVIEGGGSQPSKGFSKHAAEEHHDLDIASTRSEGSELRVASAR